MRTILTIAGTDYDGTAADGGPGESWLPAGWLPDGWLPGEWLPEGLGGVTGWSVAGIGDLEFSWDLEAHWSLSFSVYRICSSYPPFVPGVEVRLRTTDDDGSNPRLRFVGDLLRPESHRTPLGITWAYTCTDLKCRADWVTLSGLDGSGTASFNLTPDDPLALYNTSGKTVGEVVRLVLEQTDNAAALSALGVGAYTTLSPPTLPGVTLAELAALQVVPPEPVQLRGESIANTLEQFILHWHPQYCLWIEPDGTFRCRSIRSLDPVAVALPMPDGSGDDCEWPEFVGPDCTDCFTAWEVSGLDIQAAYLSVSEGTLSPAWQSYQQAEWTIADFLQPKNASDDGDLSGVTSSSATVKSDYIKAHWPINFWNGPNIQGWIYFSWPAGTGIEIYEMRQITSCTALTAGGTATVTWDGGLPLNSTAYTRYRIVGRNAPLALVDREFHVREPATGKLDLETWVGSHMYPRSPRAMPLANNSRILGDSFYPYAFVRWSRNGDWPWWEMPVDSVQINPTTGRIILSEPAVMKSAALAGATSVLGRHYPANFAEGLWSDILVVVPYNRGRLSARAPASGFEGQAFEQFGIARTFVQKIDTFNWIGDQPSLRILAQEHLDTVKDPSVSGSIDYYELPTNYDALAPGFALNVSAAGASTPLDGLDLPARSATIRWHDEGPVLRSASIRFNNKKRPFEGDSLYIHPALGRHTFGMEDDRSVFVAAPGVGPSIEDDSGRTVGSWGGMELHKYNDASMDESDLRRAAMPTNALSHESVGRDPAGAHPLGEHPAGQDSSDNPIARSLQGDQGGPQFSDDISGLLEGGAPGRAPKEARGTSHDFVGPPRPGPNDRAPSQPGVNDAMLAMASREGPDPGQSADPGAPDPASGAPIVVPEPATRKTTLRERRGGDPETRDDTLMGAGGGG